MQPMKSTFLKQTALIFFISLISLSQLSVANSATAESDGLSIKPQADFSQNVGTFIDTTMQVQMMRSDIPAATVSVVKNGELIFSKGYGLSNIAKDTAVDAENSLFRIGSISKLFTWTAIMQLHEKGLVDLDADINLYLNDFTIPNVYGEPITLRHLLTHTAGFEDGWWGYLIRFKSEDALPLDKAMKKYLPARINPPGMYSSYSNYGTALTGLIIQNVTKQPFNEYIEQQIFQPLSMTNSSFEEPLPDNLVSKMTQGYSREIGLFEPQPFEVITSFGPAGAMTSSANDMAKFMQAHLNNGELNGRRILQPETAKLMHSTLFQADKRLNGMAYGFYENTINGHELIGHAGDTIQFHSDLKLDKKNNIGIFISIMTTEDPELRGSFVKAIYDRFFPQELLSIEPPNDFEKRAQQYIGRYQSLRHNQSTIEKLSLVLGSPISVSSTGKGTLLISNRQFVEIGEHLFRQVDGSNIVAFGKNNNGNISSLYFNSHPYVTLIKVTGFDSSLYKLLLPILCFLLFLQVTISWFYKRKTYRNELPAQRRLIYSNTIISLINIIFIIILGLVIVSSQMEFYEGIPSILKISLILPVLSTLLSLFACYSLLKSWLVGSGTLGSKLYWTVVTLTGLYMSIYYYYWNLLGWNYY